MSKADRSFLEMSDEELSSFDPTKLDQPTEDEVPAEVADGPVGEAPGAEAADDSAPAAEVDQPSVEDAKADDSDDADAEAEVAAPDTPPQEEKVEPDSDDAKADVPKQDTKPETPPEGAVDYRAEYERLLAPFKANGRDISVKSVDDAIALMQMGANYNKKMAALKPNLKLLKLLENNGLLSEAKLSFLVDLEKKNPEAINKLVKDSGINPLDLDADKASTYKPSTYAVDDREIELDTVLDELQGSPAYTRMIDIVSNKWDGASKQTIVSTPQLLKVIQGHVENGVYDIISNEIENERLFGRLNGLSDIEAYRQVGDTLQARGAFDHLGRPGQQKPATPVVVPPKPKQVDDNKLRDQRRAASAPRPVAPKAAPSSFNPLALSDEEFSKVGLSQFL